ncbi:NUDIX hydrolase [Marinisporobacter balticus]|uniref:8-oxo-dGTP diphosphatase n=1 Tax=Marinisporobacter balticus TaxID=2018667 RepID=A0A4R2L7H4_9FIRM|nr:NUDIX hydrolase [Marinisporobacter balticus]TCO75175.1 8-oxo-dGTP diphosphatase [Marinisporobacter balticus]
MKTAALGIVVNKNEILLVHRKWHPILWAPAGGFIDPGETEEEAVVREIGEETGVKSQVLEKIHDFIYDNGYDVSHIHVYACQYISGSLECSFESNDVKWFPIDHLPHPISPEKYVFDKAIEISKKYLLRE